MESLRWIFEKFENMPRFLVKTLLFLFVIIFVLYYPIGMIWVHKIDDNLEFNAEGFTVENGSGSVAISIALINREVNRHHWVPNDPVFYPGSMLDRMPAFQRGVVYALSRFAIELSDQIGRSRGSSQIDSDLDKAAGLLKYPPNVWIFDKSIIPTKPSESQYREAMSALKNYNERVAKGQATFEKRSDNLLDTLDRISADLGSGSASLDNHIAQYAGSWLDTDADVLFYENKGRLYGYYLILRELGKDFDPIIKERGLQNSWNLMIKSFEEGATLGNFFIFNASPNSQLFPNHLASQGFYLLRARTQLREITNILLK